MVAGRRFESTISSNARLRGFTSFDGLKSKRMLIRKSEEQKWDWIEVANEGG